jgi:hypothetical protein
VFPHYAPTYRNCQHFATTLFNRLTEKAHWNRQAYYDILSPLEKSVRNLVDLASLSRRAKDIPVNINELFSWLRNETPQLDNSEHFSSLFNENYNQHKQDHHDGRTG